MESIVAQISLEMIVREHCPLADVPSGRRSSRSTRAVLVPHRTGGEAISPVVQFSAIRAATSSAFPAWPPPWSICRNSRTRSARTSHALRGRRWPLSGKNCDASLDSLEGLPRSRRRGFPVAAGNCVNGDFSRIAADCPEHPRRRLPHAYDAAIIAVHRSGEKLQQRSGKSSCSAGDTLLIDAGEDFVRRWRHSPDFILVSGVDESGPGRTSGPGSHC